MRSYFAWVLGVYVTLAFSRAESSSYWDTPWTTIHDRPVFRVQPTIKWNFTHPANPTTFGKIVISDDTGDILLASRITSPLFFIIDKNGREVFSWDAASSLPNAACAGTISQRNNIVYALSSGNCKLFAVSVTTGYLLWTTSLCSNSPASANPITWLKNDTLMLIVTPIRIATVNASDGHILMNYLVTDDPDYSSMLTPPIPSKIDDKFIVHLSNNIIFKLDVFTGQVEWSTQLFVYSPALGFFPPAPAVDDYGFIYAPTKSGAVHKLHPNGTVLWTTAQSRPLGGIASAPVLVNSTHMLVIASYIPITVFVVRTADGQAQQIATDVDPVNYVGLTSDPESQVYWSNNVLYLLSYDGELSAWDTMDLTTLKYLWSINAKPLVGLVIGGGLSIMKDGTIIFGSSGVNSAVVNLLALGCPESASLSEDGTCLCIPGKQLVNNTCVQCPANQFSNGTNSCYMCNTGSVPSNSQTSCTACPLNTFSHTGDASCLPCSTDPLNEQCFVPPTSQPFTAPVSVPSKGRISSATVVYNMVDVLLLTAVASLLSL